MKQTLKNNTQKLTLPIQRILVKKLVKLPPAMMTKIVGKPLIIDDQTLNLPLQLLLKLFSPPPNHLASVDETRAEFDEQGAWLSQPSSRDVAIKDIRIDADDREQITIRTYKPLKKRLLGKKVDKNLPCLVFYHGGGYVAGSLKSHDTVCQHLALQADCAVIAVDYRLAPEHPFPTPVNDGLAAFRYVAHHAKELGIDQKRIGVGGDSAGGNLAAVVAQQTKNDTIKPIVQMLWVPWVDMSRERASYELFATGLFLERAKMRWYTEQYLQDSQHKTNPLASPIFGDTTGVCPAYVWVAGFDPLRDEGVDYANKLTADGVPTTLKVYQTLPHPFINIAGQIDDAKVAFDEAVQALRQAFT